MNYLQIDRCSIENGLGVRVALWISGCTLACPGCHNPETWSFCAGKPFDKAARDKLFALLDKSWVKGLTLTGGHPLETENQCNVLMLLRQFRDRFPTKDVWLYTGLTLSNEDFMVDPDHASTLQYILALCDVVVDGPYIEAQRDITLAFRGSTNQRIIDVKKTLTEKEIVTYGLY